MVVVVVVVAVAAAVVANYRNMLKRRDRHHSVSWDHCITPEWCRRTAYLHRSAGFNRGLQDEQYTFE